MTLRREPAGRESRGERGCVCCARGRGVDAGSGGLDSRWIEVGEASVRCVRQVGGCLGSGRRG